LYLCQNYT